MTQLPEFLREKGFNYSEPLISIKTFRPGVWTKDIEKHPEEKYTFTFSGYNCKIIRNDFGVYRGSVELPEDHPLYDKSPEDLENIQVHGELKSYAKGEFSFYCGQSNDIIPILETIYSFKPLFRSHYWTLEETREELERMAQQFKDRE